MISYYVKREGAIVKVDELIQGCWINVIRPSEEEIVFLMEKFSLDRDYIIAALDEEESSRVDKDEDNALIIVDIPVVDKSGDNQDEVLYYTMPLGIIVTPQHVITVSLHVSEEIDSIINGRVKGINPHLKTQFIMLLMLFVANRFLVHLKQIDKVSNYLENKLRKSMKNKELIQLLDIQKSLVYYSTSLKADQTTLEKLMRGRYIKLYEDDQDLLEDVLIEIKQAVEMSNIYANILSGTMDAFASVISNNLNIVMKTMASVTIVMTIPNIVAGLYGMNVKSIPFADNMLFPVILSVVLMVVAAWALWKRNMF